MVLLPNSIRKHDLELPIPTWRGLAKGHRRNRSRCTKEAMTGFHGGLNDGSLADGWTLKSQIGELHGFKLKGNIPRISQNGPFLGQCLS